MFLGVALLAAGTVWAGFHALEKVWSEDPPRGEDGGRESETTAGAALDASAQRTLVPAVESAEQRARREQEAERAVHLSYANLALATAGLVSPSFALASLAGLIYTSIPIFQQAYDALFVQRRVRAAVVDTVGITSVVLAGKFWSGALLNLIYFYSRKLLLKTEDRSRQNLTGSFAQLGRTAWISVDGAEVEVPLEQLAAGAVVIVHAGQTIPVDGTIAAGEALVDRCRLTGESQPVELSVGEQVLSSTLVVSGRVHIVTEKAGTDTVAAQIARVLDQTADYRVRLESRGERLADQTALPLLALGGLAFLTRGTSGGAAVLNSNFNDNVRVAVPLTMLSSLDRAIKRGVLIKDGRVLEQLTTIDTVVFDKTGTLTLDQLELSRVHLCGELDEAQLLTCAAAIESKQTHPIARCIVQEAAQRQLVPPELESVSYTLGNGLEGKLGDRRIQVGSLRFMALRGLEIPDTIRRAEEQAHAAGQSLVYVAVDDRLSGALELRPSLRPEIRTVLDALRARGLRLCILSGDHEAPTRSLATQLGIDEYLAEVLPQDKAAQIRKMQAAGRKVCFIGDGINDALALKTADASISMSGAMSIATDTAQVVMLDGDLRSLPWLFELVREFRDTVRACLAVSVGPGIVAIGGTFFAGFGLPTVIGLSTASLLATLAIALAPRLRRDTDDDRRVLQPS